MLGRIKAAAFPVLMLVLILCAGAQVRADDAGWRVSKLSGDVSVTSAGGQAEALKDGAVVKPGDNIRTGQNGRVLLMRGQESILVSPNTVMGIPSGQTSGLTTTITQQAGTILLEVEKRNVKHFAVETPYLAAVVKGTQFRVTVDSKESRVDVMRGQVEVTDFKSGQFAMVMPEQTARVASQGSLGLALSGSGALNPVQQGSPRSAPVSPIAAQNAAPPSTPPTRVASALAEGQPIQAVRNWSGGETVRTGGDWRSFFSLEGSDSGSGTKRNRNENIALAIAISCGVGFVVALGVGAQRRRQKQKLQSR